MIKAIIFDYFGVICTNWYWKQIKHDKKMQTSFPSLADRVNKGELSWQGFLEEVGRKTGQTVSELQKLYETEMIQPEVLAYAAELHEHYKTAILTNAHHDFIDPAIKGAQLHKIFDAIVISSLSGVLKPDPQSFQNVLTKLDVQPAEAVLIDDNEDHVKAAKSQGLRAILYKDFPELKKELEILLAER